MRLCSVLLVTASQKTADHFARVLPTDRFEPPLTAPSAAEAKRAMLARRFDIVVIDTPLPDDFGMRLATDLAEYEAAGILMLVKAEQYEPADAKAMEYGVMVLQKPVSPGMLLQTLGLLTAMTVKLRRIAERAENLQAKMDEIKLVNRAKLLLVEKLRMTEPEAHRFIEKGAMDRCVKRSQVAKNIIRTYEN